MAKIEKALELLNKSKFPEALSLLEEIVKSEPQNSEAWRLIAQVHWIHQHKTDEAYDELIESLKCDPENIWALILMGNLLTKEKNDVNGAKKYYDKVLEHYPDNAIAINNIGGTYVEHGDYEQALPYLQKAHELDKTYTNSYYGLGLCYYKMGKMKECFDICCQGVMQSVDRPENPEVRQEILKLYLTAAKELSSKTNYIHIWNDIKAELESVDNVNIRFVEDEDIQVNAKLEYAPLHMAKDHVLRYNPKKPYVDHLFIHEMMHLKMDQQASIKGRGKAVISSEATRNAFMKRYKNYMTKTHSHIPAAELNKAMLQLADGIGLQLMNCPLDLFVEQLIFDSYKQVHPIQLLSLFNQEQVNIDSVKRAISSNFFPNEIVKANKIMNIVTSMHFKKMYGIDLIHEYKPTRNELEHAKDLFEEFEAYLDSYKAGDEFEMMEYFVQSFGMSDLIEIVDESQITNGMKADISLKSDLKEKAKDALSREEANDANAEFAKNHQDGADATETTMMSMYMLAAMEYFDTLEPRDVHRIAVEIATVGVSGINPKDNYSIKSMPNKTFGGFEFLAYYYVSWARAIPHMLDKLGLPFSKAYELALQMYNARKKQ